MKFNTSSTQLTLIFIITFCCTLLLPTGIILGNSNSSENQESKNSQSNSDHKVVFLEGFDPPGDGRPKDTEVGGTRDDSSCGDRESPIKILMPKGNYGLTLQERPKIYLYLPLTSAQKVLLSFKDEAGNYYQKVVLPITNNSQTTITAFSLPDSLPPLTVGKNYQWFLSVTCGEYAKPGDPTFTGWVQRVNPNSEIVHQLTGKQPLETIQWYGKNGYWYDMLSTISSFDHTLWHEVMNFVANG